MDQSPVYRTYSERQRILESRPLARVRRFATLLNWHGLQLETITLESDELDEAQRLLPMVLTGYATTDWQFFLQINQENINTPKRLWAAVVAYRYGLRGDFRPFELFDDDEALKREADRLRPCLIVVYSRIPPGDDSTDVRIPNWTLGASTVAVESRTDDSI